MKTLTKFLFLLMPFFANCQNLGTGFFGKVSINTGGSTPPTEQLKVVGTANISGAFRLGDIVNVRDSINAKLSTSLAASIYAPINNPTFTGTTEFAGNVNIGDTYTFTVAGDIEYNNFPDENAIILGNNVGKMSWGKLGNSNVSATANIDGSKLGTGIVSTKEFNYLDGVTSSIQNQLSSKLNISTAASTYVALEGNQSITGTKSFSTIEATTANVSNLNVSGSVIFPIFQPNTSVFLKQDGTNGAFEAQSMIFQSDVENLGSSLASKSSLSGDNTFSGVNIFSGTNTFLTPIFANSTSTSAYSSITGAWSNTGNLGIFSFRYNTKVGSNTVTWNPIRLDANGWVGFGMNPTQAFEVLGAAKFNSAITATSILATSNVAALSFSSSTGANFATSSGNVGIGTQVPDRKLVVDGQIGFSYGDGGSYVGLSSTADKLGLQFFAGVTSSATNNSYRFSDNTGQNIVVIQNGGNVGIGTTSPTSKIHVVGLPVYADNTTATAGGLTAGAFYRTAVGVLMVVF